MSRPTIAMACILKNEAHNIGPMLQSVRGCFDEIVMVDTGSTDGSLEFLERINAHIDAKDSSWTGLPKITIKHFKWVNDFAAARNYAFEQCTSEYIFWGDLDDSLSSAEAFINWRDTVLHTAHYWIAVYNYAFDANGNVECQFVRERVVKNNFGFRWKYFVHEGIVQTENKQFWPARVTTWTINHRRTPDDRKADHNRNLQLFEAHDYEALEPRMKYYYGKELVESSMPERAGKPLLDAMKSPQLEMHDRVLALQYACQSAMATKAYAQVINMAHNSLQLVPSRAEAWCMIGDAYLAMGQLENAKGAFRAALTCKADPLGGFVVVFNPAYFEYPHVQLASIHLSAGDPDGAIPHVEALERSGLAKGTELRAGYDQIKNMITVRTGLPKVDDIAIICPPQGAVTDWDENTLQTVGHGGSETAAIEVAKFLKEKTGRPVKIFQPRAKREVMRSGVEYIPASEIQGYLQNVQPARVINWRHPTRLSEAPTYIWCHDLVCPGAENTAQYDKIFALSQFHKDYLHQIQGIPFEKMSLMFNGINPDDFDVGTVVKQPNKIVFSSSPDRGLDRSIRIIEKAREISGLDLELHCFYGFANMLKSGNPQWVKQAEDIQAMIKDRPWVKYHGMVTKKTLMRHFKEASTWIYPANFIETFCITAWEALAAGVWPIVRDMGALKYTMKDAIANDMCEIMDVDCETEAEVGIWANRVVEAVIDHKYKKVLVRPHDLSWERVADAFIAEMKLERLA